MVKRLLASAKKKGLGDIFLALSFVASLLGLLFYVIYGKTRFNPELSNEVIVPSILLIVAIALLGFIGFKEGKFIAFCFSIYVLIEYITTQATYIANVFVAIDGNSFTPQFLVALLGYLLTLILLLLSYLFTKRFSLKEDKEVLHEKAR